MNEIASIGAVTGIETGKGSETGKGTEIGKGAAAIEAGMMTQGAPEIRAERGKEAAAMRDVLLVMMAEMTPKIAMLPSTAGMIMRSGHPPETSMTAGTGRQVTASQLQRTVIMTGMTKLIGQAAA